MPPIAMSIEFEGDNDRAFAATATIGFPVKEAGAYWFELALDEVPLTYTAIRVIYMRTSFGPIQPAPESHP